MDMFIQDQIVELLEDECLSDAAALLEKYLRLEGKDEFYYLASSDVRLGYEDYEGVITLLEEAMDTGISGPLIWERMADAKIGADEYESARSYLEMVRDSGEMDPGDEPRILFDLGRCAIAAEDYRQAVQHFEDLLLEEDNPETRFLLGMSYGELEQYDRMDDAFLGLLADPEYKERIMEYMVYQDNPDVLVDYMFRSQLPEFDQRMTFSQFWLYHDSPLEAAEELEEAFALRREPEILTSAVILYAQCGKTAKARRLFRQLMALDVPSQDPELYAGLSLEALEVLEYGEKTCRGFVRTILARTGHSPEAVLCCAQFCLNHVFSDMAYELLQNQPEDLESALSAQWSELKTRACLQAEFYQEAYHCLKANPAPQDRLYRKNLAIASYCTGRSREALTESLAILPDGIGAIIAFLVYDERGEQEKAADVIRQMRRALAKEEPIEDLSNFIGFLEEIAGKTAA